MMTEILMSSTGTNLREAEKEWTPSDHIVIIKLDDNNIKNSTVWLLDNELFSFDKFVELSEKNGTMVAMWEAEAGSYDENLNTENVERIKFLLDGPGEDSYLVVSSNKIPIDLVMLATLNALKLMYQNMEEGGEQ